MGWKMLEKPRTLLASKPLVQEFCAMEPAPHDRPLSERRMLVYERILRSGDFRPVTWASVLCHETACTYRVNGKHTSTLLAKRDPIPTFYVTLERWECDTLNDVASLYATYDSNLSSRTAQDVNLSFAATLPELRDVNARLINLTVSSAAYLKWEDAELRKVPQAERAEELLDRVDFVKWLVEIITTSTDRSSLSKHLLRSPVVCAMMATYDRYPKKAMEFWCLVRDESHAERDDPSRTLSRFLVRASLTRRDAGKETKKVGHREMFVKCLHAWNAWRKGETTSLAYHGKAPVPTISK